MFLIRPPRWENLVGVTGFEPSDPSLVRRNRYVARRRLPSPEEPASWTLRRLTSPYIAWCLPTLAPHLAPRDLVGLANGWCQHWRQDACRSPPVTALGWRGTTTRKAWPFSPL